jgi:hypothetical protein
MKYLAMIFFFLLSFYVVKSKRIVSTAREQRRVRAKLVLGHAGACPLRVW